MSQPAPAKVAARSTRGGHNAELRGKFNSSRQWRGGAWRREIEVRKNTAVDVHSCEQQQRKTSVNGVELAHTSKRGKFCEKSGKFWRNEDGGWKCWLNV